MKSWHTSRAGLFCYTFLFLGLAALVFTWGLQYKVSLYAAPHSAIHQMVKAKLLTNEKQSAAKDRAELSGVSKPAPVQTRFDASGFWFGVLALIVSGAISTEARDFLVCERSRVFRYCIDLDVLFYRPPPPLHS